MLINTQEGRQLINEAAYAVMRQEAPQELPMYVTIRDQYFADPERFVESQHPEDEALGFGGVALTSSLSQVVFPVVTAILVHVVNEAAKAMKDEGGKRAADWVRCLFASEAKKDEPQAQPLFTAAQLEVIKREIQQIAEMESRRIGVSKRSISRVSDAVIARLAPLMT
jgi:hypothetical protein